MYALIGFMAVDYATGLMCAIIEKKLSSIIGFRGIFKKVLILVMVGIAHAIDRHIIGTGEGIRTAVLMFYMSNEGVSLLENAARIGLPIPVRIYWRSCAESRITAMTINRKICPNGLKNNPNKNLTAVRFVTIHTTGNYKPTATAKGHAAYIFNGSGGARVSWHYSVDATEIYQHFEDYQACWHAGDAAFGPGNMTSLAIEICVNDKAACSFAK